MSGVATVCRGVTISGQPCKNKVRDGAYCRFHVGQDSNNKRSSRQTSKVGEHIPGAFGNQFTQITQTNLHRSGFIYIYTYKLLYEGICKGSVKDLQWLKIDNSVLTHKKSDRNLDWTNKSQILCKIGMTTKSNVQLRLNEWENSCSHKIINLTPSNIDLLITSTSIEHSKDINRLSKLMHKLSIRPSKHNKSIQKGNHQKLKLYSYNNGGFHMHGDGPMSLQDIENSLHQLLWKKYGKGIIHCSGCQKRGASYKKHIEWFVIPILDLPNILETIDNFCFSQNKSHIQSKR